MRRFDYRAPRVLIDLPILFAMGSLTRAGRCREISADGMKIQLGDRFPPGSEGTIDLKVGEVSFLFPVRVARAELDYDAVQFILDTQEQREAVNRLVACLGAPRPCTSLTVAD